MPVYAVIDPVGKLVVNIVVWDGVTPWTPMFSGAVCHPYQAGLDIGQTPSAAIIAASQTPAALAAAAASLNPQVVLPIKT